MSEPANTTAEGELDTQLWLFCYLMLGSVDATDRVMRQIYLRARAHHGDPRNRQSERVQLFRIAADLCGSGDSPPHE
ncbi:MAG: hypothetical protein HOW97_11965 [Catenulispora sp.]|nr:hypothetical protein [Catenulispora sp.]